MLLGEKKRDRMAARLIYTAQYYFLRCPPFLRFSTITYTAHLFYGAVLLLTVPAFFTVQY